MHRQKIFILLQAVAAGLLTGIVRLLSHPAGLNTYGYDYGWYAYTIQHTPLNSLGYFLGVAHDYGNHLFVILNWLHLPQIPSLHFTFILFASIAGSLFYLILRKHSRLTAVVGTFLFITSIAQTQLFTMFLWKAAYGQVLLLAIILLLELGYYGAILIPTALLFITHKTTSVIMLLSAVVYAIAIAVTKQKQYLYFLFALLIISGGYVWLFDIFSLATTARSSSVIHSGLFLTIADYFSAIWFMIPFVVFGIYTSLKTNRNGTWLAITLVSGLWLIGALPLYQRVILYFDTAAIALTAIGITSLPIAKKYTLVLATIVCALSLLMCHKNAHYITPQISQEDITEITAFSNDHQGAFVLALSANDGPWLLANLSGNVRLAAPGLFEDYHTETEWINFWNNPTGTQFFNHYPRPLFLYVRSSTIYQNYGSCLQPISKNFLAMTCE